MNADTFHRVVTVIACTSIVITAVYILRVVGKILYGTCDQSRAPEAFGRHVGRAAVGRLPRRRHRRHRSGAAVGERHDPRQRREDHCTYFELSDYGLHLDIYADAGRSDPHGDSRLRVPLRPHGRGARTPPLFGRGLLPDGRAGGCEPCSGCGGRTLRRHVLPYADGRHRQKHALRRGADRLPAVRHVAAPRGHAPQAGRILHPDPLDAAGHVFYDRRGQLPAVLHRSGAGFGPDGLSGGLRQIQTLFGRGGGQIHPLRAVLERTDALRHLVPLRNDRDALFRRHGRPHRRFAVAGDGPGLLPLGAWLQAFRSCPSTSGRRTPTRARRRT